MAKNEKSQAEQYREERKARIAKSTKKNDKKSVSLPGGQVATRKTDKIITIVICAVLVLVFFGWLINFTGVAQRTLSAVKVGDESISQAEYAYYYKTTYSSYANMAYSYDQNYGSGMGLQFTGYDYSKAPEDQTYTGSYFDDKKSDDATVGTSGDEETYTFADYFRAMAVDTAQQAVVYEKLAKEANISLDADDLAEIDDQIEELRTQLAESEQYKNYSVSAFLKNSYGNGCNESFYRSMLERTALANKYADARKEELGKAVSDADITAVYESQKDSYDVVDASVFEIEYSETASSDDDSTLTKTQAKAKADKMLAAVSNAENFAAAAVEASTSETDKTKYASTEATEFSPVSMTTLKSNFDQKVSDWAFSTDRATGDKTVIETDSAYYVVLLLKARYLDNTNTVDVRHILVKYADNATDDQKKATYTTAENVLKQWQDGEATEESFAKLAKEQSGDTGSADNGGLYENVYKGQMVDSFENWCFDESRKTGDTGIVVSDYGCHVMYFVKKNDEPQWKSSIRSATASTKFSDTMEELLDSSEYAVKYKEKKLDRIIDKIS